MQEKYNEATFNRPEGDRPIDLPMLEINIPEFIQQLKSEDTWNKYDHNAITVFKTDALRLVLIAMHQNAELPKHDSEGIISVQVIEGNIEFITDEKTANLRQQEMVTLHEGIPHSVRAVQESVILLTMARC
jgi:quercetin dioxygenase-like cupin family protein